MKVITTKIKQKIRNVFKEYLDEQLASVKIILWERVSIRDNTIHDLSVRIDELEKTIKGMEHICTCGEKICG